MNKKRLILGISGASCAKLGIILLEEMQKQPDWETHLIITHGGEKTILHETNLSLSEVKSLGTFSYNINDIGAAPASGSFTCDGMIIVPCSMKSLAAIAQGYSENLLLRAADVSLKERRPLVLVTRESPLNKIHIKNMLAASDAGAIICPPVMEFYSKANSLDQMTLNYTNRLMRLFGIKTKNSFEWKGINPYDE